MVIVRAWAVEGLRATLDVGIDFAEHHTGALIQEEYDDGNVSGETLATWVGRHETSCPSGEDGSISGMDG